MDDFRVGSVPSTEPYGHRQPLGSNARKRQRHHQGEGADSQADSADTFDLMDANDIVTSSEDDPVEDYYLPSAADNDAE